MAKYSQIKENSQEQQKTTQQSKKYTCGCGKTYTSYPAYSTHRKTKHNNKNVQGTIIPKSQNPKRGRPSYEFVKRNQVKIQKLKNYYQSLTVIQLGLLKLNDKYDGRILSQSHQSNHYTLPEELKIIGSHDTNVTRNEDLVYERKRLENQLKIFRENNTIFVGKLIILFIQLMTTHMTTNPSIALIEFLTEFVIYFTETKKANIHSESSQNEQQAIGQNRKSFDISLFNEYFSRGQNKQQLTRLSTIYDVDFDYFVNVSVILSHWIYKLGYCQKVIKPRVQNNNNHKN